MDRVELHASDILERGRDCYQRRQWVDAFAAFSQADQIEPLDAARPLVARLVCTPQRPR